jgi:hypothetical protein
VVTIDSVWRRASVPAALAMLRDQNGEAKALRIARLELRKARQARSRKRFDFWSAVSTELEIGLSGNESPEKCAGKEPAAKVRRAMKHASAKGRLHE